MTFRFPGAGDRTTIIGATGSGKSTCGVWMLGHQRFDKRPWIVFDFKAEVIFDRVGFPPIRHLALTDPIPKARGLYLVSPLPGQDDALEAFLWRVWRRGNVGLYIDETALVPASSIAFRAIYQQGRSKRIPVISCTQRPVDVVRTVFSEASFFAIYRITDKRDYRVIEGFVPADLSAPVPPFHWRWYDVAHSELLAMAPVPAPERVADMLADRLPAHLTWHPFSWIGRPTDRERVRL